METTNKLTYNTEVSPEKILFFQNEILQWFKQYGRTFYWRKKGLSNYQYIIAEILLQRTKAETIANFYSKFITEFPSWKALVEADIRCIENYLKPIGLYNQRSTKLKKLALEMVRRHGRLPKNRKDLESIPFMGQYIANAVELVIFNQPSPLVDVNMARVLERFFGERKLADIRYDPYLQALSYKVVEHEKAKKINWGILDFAALLCQARKPKCSICPVRSRCLFFQSSNLRS